MGVGAMFPFCRGHSETDTIDHEPWSFGEEVCLCFVYMFLKSVDSLKKEKKGICLYCSDCVLMQIRLIGIWNELVLFRASYIIIINVFWN